MVKHLLYILFFFGVASAATAQTKDIKQYVLFNENSGNRITTIHQLQNRLLLVGTTNGVYRFDGINFLRYPSDTAILAHVTAVYQSSHQTIYIGFHNGAIGVVENAVVKLLHVEEGFPKVAVKAFKEDAAGNLWIATAGEGLYILKNKRLYNINADDGLSDNYVYDIDLKEKTIIAATDRGINYCSFNNGKKSIRSYTSKNGLPDNIVRCITVAENHTWLGFEDKGIFVPETKTQLLQNSSFHYSVNDIVKDNELVWMATSTALLQTSLEKKSTEKTTTVIAEKINALIKDAEGNIWAASDFALHKLNSGYLQPVYTFSNSAAVTVLHADKKEGAIWINTDNGIAAIRNGNVTAYSFPFKNATVTDMYQHGDDLWIGTMDHGLIKFNQSNKQFSSVTSSILPAWNILSVSGLNNQIWISSLEGVFKLTTNQGNITSVENITATKKLSSHYVYDILPVAENDIWFATDGDGLGRLFNNEFKKISTPANQEKDVVYKMAADKNGQIWFLTRNNGLCYYDGKTIKRFDKIQQTSHDDATLIMGNSKLLLLNSNHLHIIDVNTGLVKLIGEEQGLDAINLQLNAVSASDRHIYFVSDNRIYQYNTTENYTTKPALFIEEGALFLQPFDLSKPAVFNADENNISFAFTGLYYSNPSAILYQYKLEGLQQQWIETKDRKLNFPKLSPGKYVFKVRALLQDDNSTYTEVAYTFIIRKPIWQQWWFIMLLSIGIIATLYAYIKAREKRLQRLNRLENEKLSLQFETLRNQVNPHFLFNSFNALISEIENHPQQAVEYVEHLSDFYRNIVLYREKDIIPLSEEMKLMDDYFFIQKKRYGNALQTEVSITKQQGDQYMLAPLTMQLLIENAVKHNALSMQTPLHIQVDIREDYLVIENNINPKFAPEKGTGLGLHNIQKRYKLLTGKEVIVEHNGKSFRVSVPLMVAI